MDQFFALDDALETKGRRADEPARKEYHRLMDAIAASPEPSFLAALVERAASDQPRRVRLMADLLARHGGPDDKPTLAADADSRAGLVAIVQRWMDVMLTSPEANRHQAADVVRAVERLAEPMLVTGLQRMLERDLADWARARDEHFKMRRGGPLSPDVTHSYTLQYRRAFAAIGSAEVIALMKGYLPDLRFGFEAACVLRDIWVRKHPSAKERRFSSRYDFSEVKARRLAREDAQKPPPTCEFAEAIFAVVSEMGNKERDDATLRHALALGKIGLSLPHGNKRGVIDRLIELPQPFATKREVLTAAAMAGEIVPAEVIRAGLRELIEAAKKDAWRLDENRGELMGWVELFAFCDRPMAVFDGLELLPPERSQPWALRRLLSALRHSPDADALGVLETLAERDPRFLSQHEWLDSIIKMGSETSARALLELICSGKLKTGRSGVDLWRLSQELAALGHTFPAIRDEIVSRYQSLAGGEPKALLESALAEMADAQIIPTLIRGYAAGGKTFDGRLARAMREIAVGRRPAVQWPGAFEQFSVPLVTLRRELFAMLATNDAQARLSEACLVAIEELRDEHGRINDEPRHPDIASGRPWPREA